MSTGYFLPDFVIIPSWAVCVERATWAGVQDQVQWLWPTLTQHLEVKKMALFFKPAWVWGVIDA